MIKTYKARGAKLVTNCRRGGVTRCVLLSLLLAFVLAGGVSAWTVVNHFNNTAHGLVSSPYYPQFETLSSSLVTHVLRGQRDPMSVLEELHPR